MALTGHRPAPPHGRSAYEELIPALTRRLAAHGLTANTWLRHGRCELAIANVHAARSSLTLHEDGAARWYYEPITGAATDPAALTAVIAAALSAPHAAPAGPPGAYHAFPLKGQVGRSLQDRGLTVTLRVSEDWESFEATTDIDITSPARPWLGTITLSDDAALDWYLDWQAAFPGNPATLIDVITPILRASYAKRPAG